MFYGIFLVILPVVLVILLVASITDIKTREVPDWLSYGSIFLGFGIRLFYSASTGEWAELLWGVLGFAVLTALGYFMFYTAQWGGGDSKLVMGLGALFGLSLRADDLVLSFLVNTIFVGAAYGFVFSLFLAVVLRKRFLEESRRLAGNRKILLVKRSAQILSVGMLALSFFIQDTMLVLGMVSASLILLLTFYIWIFIRVVERSCLTKDVKPSALTEGDWILENIVMHKKSFLKLKDRKIDQEHVQRIQGYAEEMDFKVVVRRYGFLARRLPLSKLRDGDVLLKSARVGKKSYSAKLSHKDIAAIKIYLRKNLLVPISVERKFLGMKRSLRIDPSQLKAGMLAKEDLYKAYIVSGPSDLGIERSQIAELKRLGIRMVKIKEGMPFVPVFLISFLITLWVGNLVVWFTRIY